MKAAPKDLRKVVDAAKDAARDMAAAIQAVRDQIADKQDDRRAIETASVPLTDALARLDGWVDHFETDALKNADLHVFTRPDFGSPNNSVDQLIRAGALRMMQEPMREAIRHQYNTRAGLSAVDRNQALISIDREILDLELTEEAMIRHAEASGMELLRRNDADPRAVLAADEVLP